MNGNAVWIAKTWLSPFLSNFGTDQESCCDAASSQCKSSCFRVGGLHPAIARCGEVLRIGPIGPALRRFVENVQKVQRFIYYEVIWYMRSLFFLQYFLFSLLSKTPKHRAGWGPCVFASGEAPLHAMNSSKQTSVFLSHCKLLQHLNFLPACWTL